MNTPLSLNLSQIATWMNARFSGIDAPLHGISIDSRTLSKGDLYVALKGERVDGHAFIKEVENKGAVGVLVSEDIETKLPILKVSDTVLALGQMAKHYRALLDIPIVAVTGSCGKTTVKDMLFHILSCKGPTLATQGNLNTDIGVPLTLLKLNATHQYAVIEMGARKKNDIAYLMQITSPHVSILTNAGVAHVEIFGSTQGIVRAKGEIFECLDKQGVAVINQDDKQNAYWKRLLKGQRVITFGIDNQADIMAKNITNAHFDLITDLGTVSIQLPVLGKHNVMNALASAAGARALGISLEYIQEGLENCKASPGRLEKKKSLSGACVMDDTYNANPASVSAALAVLANCEGPKILVLGDMKELGAEAPRLHHQMGVEAKTLGIDQVFCLGEWTPYTVEGYGSSAKHYTSKQDLIQALSPLLTPESTVLIKGSRGMKMEEIVRALC